MMRKIDWESQIGRRLRLRDLHVFLTVIQRGSMAKASQQLGVSQPAVSEVIADLERTLGVPLLDRSTRGVEPTAYGVALLKRSVAAFDELKQSIRDIEFLADPTVGEVRVGASPVLATGFVAASIDSLARQYPRIVCNLMVGDAPVTYRALEGRNLDVVITRIVPPTAEDHLTAEILYEDRLLVAAASENPWSRRRRVALPDLMNEPWTLAPIESLPGSWAIDSFRRAGLDLPRATVFCYNNLARIALVAKGRFLTISSESALRFAGWDTSIKSLPIDLPTKPGFISLVTLKSCTLAPVAQRFIDCVRKLASLSSKL